MIKMTNDNLKWFNEMNRDTQLVLTNDIDSLISCAIIKENTGASISCFYSFSKFYKTNKTDKNKLVGVDLDLVNGKCIGNHTTPYVNPECVGFNQTIDTTGNNYTKKFAGSTVLTLLYLYEYDFSKFTEEQLKFIISIDSGFIQYYDYRNKWNMWYNQVMGIGKYFEPILEKYTKEEMKNYVLSNGFNNSFGIKNGLISTKSDINFGLIKRMMPCMNQLQFLNLQVFDSTDIKMKFEKGNLEKLHKRAKTHTIFSWAQTYKTEVKYTYLV